MEPKQLTGLTRAEDEADLGLARQKLKKRQRETDELKTRESKRITMLQRNPWLHTQDHTAHQLLRAVKPTIITNYFCRVQVEVTEEIRVEEQLLQGGEVDRGSEGHPENSTKAGRSEIKNYTNKGLL